MPDKFAIPFKKLLMFGDYVRATESVINENLITGRLKNCNMLYLSQNLLSLDRQRVREYLILFILFEKKVTVLVVIIVIL